MSIELLIAAAIVVSVVTVLWLRHARSGSSRPAPVLDAAPAQVTPATIGPGGVLTFWDGHVTIVTTILDCEEDLHGRLTRWRWLLLDDGKVLQVTDSQLTLYERVALVQQGTPTYERFTAAADEGGLLQQFEARVRAGRVALEPVRWQDGNDTYQLRSTGTFRALTSGTSPEGVWADLADVPSQNVYFTLEGYGGAVDGVDGLGVWTSHLLVLYGRPLPPADLLGCYRPDDASRSTR